MHLAIFAASIYSAWMPFSAQHIKAARLHLQKTDPVMKKIIKQVGPFTGKTTRNRFAALVKSIVGQQISTSAARAILVRLQASVVEKPGPTFSVTPADFALQTVESLRAAGLSNQKASYVLDLVDQVTCGRVDLKNIHRLDDEAVIDQLIQVKGIGRWTAQMFLMFCLGRMDVLPVNDLGIKNAIQAAYRFDQPPTTAQIEQCGEAWRPYASIASWYLWRSLEAGNA